MGHRKEQELVSSTINVLHVHISTSVRDRAALAEMSKDGSACTAKFYKIRQLNKATPASLIANFTILSVRK